MILYALFEFFITAYLANFVLLYNTAPEKQKVFLKISSFAEGSFRLVVLFRVLNLWSSILKYWFNSSVISLAKHFLTKRQRSRFAKLSSGVISFVPMIFFARRSSDSSLADYVALQSNAPWLIVSKALDRSTYTAPVSLPLSISFQILSEKTEAVFIECLFLNPCWHSDRIFSFSRKSFSPQCTAFSRIFDKIGRTDIGLYFSGSDVFPDLKIGEILANFQLEGKLPVWNDRLIMWHNVFEMRTAQSFSNPGGRLSVPVAFWRERDLSSFCTNRIETYLKLYFFTVFGSGFGLDRQTKFVSGDIFSFRPTAILLKKGLKVLAEGRGSDLQSLFDVDLPGKTVLIADQNFFGLFTFSFRMFLWCIDFAFFVRLLHWFLRSLYLCWSFGFLERLEIRNALSRWFTKRFVSSSNQVHGLPFARFSIWGALKTAWSADVK